VSFWVALILVLALGVVLGWRQIVSPDLGWHLSYARWICENRSVPDTDPLTYTVADRSAMDLQWLFQLGLRTAMAIGGTTAVVAGTILLTLLFAGLLLVRVRRYGRGLTNFALPLILLFFLGNSWEMRPHLLSWVLGSLVLLVLEERARGNGRWLFVLPLVMVAWVNMHSLFILGLVIIGAHAAAATALAVLGRQEFDWRLLRWSALSVFSCLLNP
jgi:hypothetical protein